MRRARGRALAHPDQPLQQRLPAGAAPGQLPAARRLHRPVAGPAGAGEPVRAAADAGCRPGASAAHITAVIPHFAYARSDKKDAPRISIGARLVADMLATAGATRVLTMALHAPQVHGFFSVPVDHLDAVNVLADHFRGGDLSNTVVVSPDLGNAKMATAFARLLNVPVAAGSKRRLTDDTVVIDRIVGDVHDRTSSCWTTRSPPPARSSNCCASSGPTAYARSRWPAPTVSTPARRSSGSSRRRASPRSWPPTRCRCRTTSGCPTW